VVAAMILATGLYLRKAGLLQPQLIDEYRRSHPLTALGGFALLYGLAVFTALPTLPLNLAAGLFWGAWWGGVLSAVGSTIGAVAAFYTARLTLFRAFSRRADNRLVEWIQYEFSHNGWRTIAFLRLNPVFPTGLLNYLIGMTAVDSYTYTWATFCFLLPPSILMALLGHEMGSFTLDGGLMLWLRRSLLILAAATSLFLLRRVGRILSRSRTAAP
jgi:uncharacterized membrane protein YdjX (TVP38/TMEM64 family)